MHQEQHRRKTTTTPYMSRMMRGRRWKWGKEPNTSTSLVVVNSDSKWYWYRTQQALFFRLNYDVISTKIGRKFLYVISNIMIKQGKEK